MAEAGPTLGRRCAPPLRQAAHVCSRSAGTARRPAHRAAPPTYGWSGRRVPPHRAAPGPSAAPRLAVTTWRPPTAHTLGLDASSLPPLSCEQCSREHWSHVRGGRVSAVAEGHRWLRAQSSENSCAGEEEIYQRKGSVVYHQDERSGAVSATVTLYTTDAVTSADGTTIGYRRLGAGPGVILLHGGMEASQHLMTLATILSSAFTVYVPDRRGRGLSGPFGERYSVARDCEDVAALVEETGARNIFGLSSGALIVLRSALVVPSLERVALYEPPLSIGGSAPVSWVPRYDREVAGGQGARALATAIKGNPVEPALAPLPRPILLLLFALSMRAADGTTGDDVSVRALIPTQHYDMVVVRETADTLCDYEGLRARVLLLGGSKSPAFLKTALDALGRTLPHVERVTFPGLGHLAPTDDSQPEIVAAQLRAFFA